MMDKHDAAALSGLAYREFPEGEQEFLRCQLGEYQLKKIKTSAFRDQDAQVFRLIAFGRNWEEALDMLDRMKKNEQ